MVRWVALTFGVSPVLTIVGVASTAQLGTHLPHRLRLTAR
jgi:hypothetical protein